MEGIPMEHMAYVNITKTDNTEEEVEVYFELDDFYECMEADEKIDFIIEQTKKQYEGTQEVDFDEEDLTDLEREIDDINDPSDMIGDEDFDEFMEHENFDD